MLNRHSRTAAGLALALATGLVALPACDKKKPTDSGPPPNSGYSGSKGGPPPGFGPKKGEQNGKTGDQTGEDKGHKTGSKTDDHAGGKTGDKQADAGLPAPPTKGPQLQSSDAKSRDLSQNNLKQIGLAFHNSLSFADKSNIQDGFPIAIADSNGKPGLSWRVALLPYLEQVDLYKQFKLDEPWDGPNNKMLIEKMPKLFAPPGMDTHGYTYYRAFAGNGAIMTPMGKAAQAGHLIRGASVSKVPDGLSNTLLAAEANEPVIWTKPDDLPFTPGKPPKLGGSVFADGFNGLLCDGSVRFIKTGAIDDKTLSNLIQSNDGNPIKLP